MSKAQGALEYLLLIGGSILVAVIVIAIIIGIPSGAVSETINATANAFCAGNRWEECDFKNFTIEEKFFICRSEDGENCRAALGNPVSSCAGPAGGWQEGKTYYLENNLLNGANCLNITAPNVTLNCLGKQVEITGGERAIYISADNITVVNCAVKTIDDGILVLDDVDNATIKHNIIESGDFAIHTGLNSLNNIIFSNDTCLNPARGYVRTSDNPQNETKSGSNKCPINGCSELGGPGGICVDLDGDSLVNDCQKSC